MEFRPYVTPERGACGGVVARVALLSLGGALGFITFVLAAYAVSETRAMRDEMEANRAYPFLTLGRVKAGYAGASAYRGAGSWHDQKPMPNISGISGVSDLQAVTGNHGNVYLFGGIDTAGTVLDRVLEYDVIRQTYATNTSLIAARARFGAGALTSASTGLVDRIVVAGGVDSTQNAIKTAEYYDLSTGIPSAAPVLSYDHMDGCMASTGDAVYMMGGWRAVGYDWFSVSKVEKLTRTGTAWETMADMPSPRGDCAAAGLKGKVYVAGGYDDATFNHTVGFKKNLYMYDPATNTWTEKAPMKHERGDLQLVALDDTLLAIGGEIKQARPDGSHANIVASHYVEEYFPEKDQWEERAYIGNARFRFGAAKSDWGTHVFGGSPVCLDPVNANVYTYCDGLQMSSHEVYFELSHPDVWVNYDAAHEF